MTKLARIKWRFELNPRAEHRPIHNERGDRWRSIAFHSCCLRENYVRVRVSQTFRVKKACFLFPIAESLPNKGVQTKLLFGLNVRKKGNVAKMQQERDD